MWHVRNNGEVVIGLSAGLAASGPSQKENFAVRLGFVPPETRHYSAQARFPQEQQGLGFFNSVRSGVPFNPYAPYDRCEQAARCSGAIA